MPLYYEANSVPDSIKKNKVVNNPLKQDNTVKHIISLYVSYTLRGSATKVVTDKTGQKQVKEKELEKALNTEEDRHREKEETGRFIKLIPLP